MAKKSGLGGRGLGALIPDAVIEKRIQEGEKITELDIDYVAPNKDQPRKKFDEEKLEALSGKKVDAVYIQDSSLLGGLKVEMDDMTFDGSVEKHLQKVKGVIKG